MNILYEDNHLLVVNKPPLLTTQGAQLGEPSLVEQARADLKVRYAKPGNVFIGVVSRLDAQVSGVIVLARTSKAAARLSEQFREGTVEKEYWALVERAPEPANGRCHDWLAEDPDRRRMVVVTADAPGAREAALRYRTLRRLPRAAMLEIELETGRKHQIRVQLAARGLPILGDVKYGSGRRFPLGIALHSRRLALDHPTRRERLEFRAPVPASWREFGVEDG